MHGATSPRMVHIESRGGPDGLREVFAADLARDEIARSAMPEPRSSMELRLLMTEQRTWAGAAQMGNQKIAEGHCGAVVHAEPQPPQSTVEGPNLKLAVGERGNG